MNLYYRITFTFTEALKTEHQTNPRQLIRYLVSKYIGDGIVMNCNNRMNEYFKHMIVSLEPSNLVDKVKRERQKRRHLIKRY